MMPKRYVALLRGINNIGMAKRVSMADLQALWERLGFREVRTVRNSGNVVFCAPGARRADLQVRIKRALAEKLKLTTQVILLSAKELVGAMQDNSLADIATDPSRLLVVVPRQHSDRERLKPLLHMRWAPERLAVGKRVAYLWCARGLPESLLWPAVDRALLRSGTVQNWGTFEKLMQLIQPRVKARK